MSTIRQFAQTPPILNRESRIACQGTRFTSHKSLLRGPTHLRFNVRQESRRFAELRRLLERVCQLDQHRLAPRPPEKRNPYWQTAHKSRQHIHVGIPRHRRKFRASSAERVAVHDVRQPCWPAGRRNDGIELLFVHGCVNSLFAGQLMVFLDCVHVLLGCQRPFFLGLQKILLSEKRHLFRRILFVELDNLLQRLDRRVRPKPCKIRIQIRLQLVHEPEEFRLSKLAGRLNLHRIDKRRPLFLHNLQRCFHKLIHRWTKPERFSQDPDARASQPVGFQKLGVIRERFPNTRCRRAIIRVNSSERPKQYRCVAHRSAHWSRGVLRVRNWNDMAPAHEPHRRLDSRKSVRRRGAHNRSVRFRSNSDRRKIRRNSRARSRTRSARISVQRVRIFRLSPAPAPSADRMARANIRPFAQICFSQNHGARGAQFLRDERIVRRFRARQRQRSRGGLHPVRRRNVVFDQYGYSVQRPARPFFFPLLVERFRNFQRVRICLDDAVHRRAALVNRRNARQIFLRNRARRVFAGLHSLLQFANRDLIKLKRRNIRSLRQSRVPARRCKYRLQNRTSRGHCSSQKSRLQKFSPACSRRFASFLLSASSRAFGCAGRCIFTLTLSEFFHFRPSHFPRQRKRTDSTTNAALWPQKICVSSSLPSGNWRRNYFPFRPVSARIPFTRSPPVVGLLCC